VSSGSVEMRHLPVGPGDSAAAVAFTPAGALAPELEWASGGDRPPRILIVDDDPLAARALRRVLEQAGGTVVAAASGPDAVELARHHAPDMAFVDIGSPVLDCLPLIRALAALDLGIRPILLSVDRDADAVLSTIRAGGRGILSKSELLDFDLPRLLSAAMRGELVCSRRMASAMVDRLASLPVVGVGYRPVRSRLTSREWEVLDLLCDRRSNDQIADDLVIAIETVRTHVKNVMRKLGVSSRHDVIARAARLRGELAWTRGAFGSTSPESVA
jgi:two-component system, NarL family, response regulator LiaR